jgi:phosphopantothenate-cysteine ligase
MNVVVTAGGTVAPIDDVRQITNVSTGRFGAMIAEAALKKGANVWYVHAPKAQRPFDRLAHFDLEASDPSSEFDRLASLREHWLQVRNRCHFVPLTQGTVTEYAKVLETVLRRESIDVAFLAMAASDFAPEPFSGKLSSDSTTQIISCLRLPKVIQSVRDWSPEVYLVGFKLLSNASIAELMRQAEQATIVNRADLTVANDLSSVKAGRHTIHLVRPGQPVETLGPDGSIAEGLVDRVWNWATIERH